MTRTDRVRPLVCTAVLLASLKLSPTAQAAFSYLDSTNPGGVPDLSQYDEPICGAAAASDAFWDWSDNAPFNALTHPLVGHTNRNNFAVNWGSDSDNATTAMANWIYGPRGPQGRNAGFGMPVGMETRAKSNNQAYNARNYPLGISIRWRHNPTYAAINTIVQNAQSNAVLGISWFQEDGTPLPRFRGGPHFHALALAGMDDDAKRMAVSNPWGNHAAPMDPNPPVSIPYYDTLGLDPAVILDTGMPRFPVAYAENRALGTTFDGDGRIANYMGVTDLWEVRRGGSPNVVADVTPAGMDQLITYTVANPDELQPMSHVYLKLDLSPTDLSTALASAQAYLAGNLPSWNAALLDPNTGPEKAMFGVPIENDPAVTPQYELDDWTNGLTALHFWSDVDPLNLGEQLTLAVRLPATISPAVFDDVYAVSDAARQLAYFGVTQGVPEPAALTLVAIGLAIYVQRRRT